MNWNKVLVVTFGLAVLAGLVLHQGQVAPPVADDDALMTGTALAAPADGAPGGGQDGKSPGQAECRNASDADANGEQDRECREAGGAAKLAHNDNVH